MQLIGWMEQAGSPQVWLPSAARARVHRLPHQLPPPTPQGPEALDSVRHSPDTVNAIASASVSAKKLCVRPREGGVTCSAWAKRLSGRGRATMAVCVLSELEKGPRGRVSESGFGRMMAGVWCSSRSASPGPG